MVEYIKTKNKYFYKIYKNGKNKRISEKEYFKKINKKYILKGGDLINNLISNTMNNLKITELPEDIEEINCYYNNKPGCIKCKICGSISGNLKIISHYYSCKYKDQRKTGPFTVGKRHFNNVLDSSISIGILQREYGIIDNTTSKHIIGSYGAGPCVILCMRDKESNKTLLAHIDRMTIDPLSVFSIFQPDKTDVYIIGGNNSSKKNVNDILIQLKGLGFQIKFAHIITYESNSFAINCLNGDTYIDSDINPLIHLPYVYNKNKRNNRLKTLISMPSKLEKVDIL